MAYFIIVILQQVLLFHGRVFQNPTFFHCCAHFPRFSIFFQRGDVCWSLAKESIFIVTKRKGRPSALADSTNREEKVETTNISFCTEGTT